MPLEEVAAAYHDETPTPASTFLRNIIDEAVVNMTEKKEFDLPASIFSRSSQGTRIYSTVGFISECELRPNKQVLGTEAGSPDPGTARILDPRILDQPAGSATGRD